VEVFINRWLSSAASERANYQLFLSELCDVLNVSRPNPAGPDHAKNAYVFERGVVFHHGDGTQTTGSIDLYKRECFVLEAKQGSDQKSAADLPLFGGLDDWRTLKGRIRILMRILFQSVPSHALARIFGPPWSIRMSLWRLTRACASREWFLREMASSCRRLILQR